MNLLVDCAASGRIRPYAAQIEQSELYYRELVDWNRKMKLTTITKREQVQPRHFLDFLAVHTVLPAGMLANEGRVADIGSGPGFPGLPLIIAFPSIRLTLIDSMAKRVSFLQHMVSVLRFDNVEVVRGRAEDLSPKPRLRGGLDLGLARALAKLPVLAELMLPFCHIGGVAVVHKGPDVREEVREAKRAVHETGGVVKLVRRFELDHDNFMTSLILIEKVSETPDRFPRRPGVPSKRLL